MYKITLLISSLILFFNSFAQKGKPFIEKFTPSEYLGEDQVWTINQNKNGVMFLGAGDGLLKYDGVNWEKNLINKDKPPVLSSVFGNDNFLYIGSVGEFGYFNSDDRGKIKYNSLKNLLDTSEQLFTNVWSVAKSNNNIYFSTDNGIFRFNKNLTPKIKKIGKQLKPFLIYNPNNEVFVYFRNSGLYKINGDKLIKIKINTDLQPWFMLPYEKNTYLVGSSDDNLQLLYFNENDTIAKIIKTKFNKAEITKTNIFFKENKLYTGACVLNKNEFAIGTIRHGIVVVDKKGRIIEVIGKKKGLLSSTVHTLFLDKQGELWAGLSYGISKIEYNSPFRFFNEKDGITGTIYNLTKFKNKIYASSNLGLFYYENNHFIGIDTFTGKNSVQVFLPSIFTTNNGKDSVFIVSTINGIYSIQNDHAKKINSLSPNSLFQSEFNKSIFYLSLGYELMSFSLNGNNFSTPKTIHHFNKIINSGTEKDSNNLWLILEGKPVIFNIKSNKIINFSNNKEINKVSFNEISKEDKKNIFLTNNGIYEFNSKTNKFYKNKLLIPQPLNSSNVLQFNYVSKKLNWALLGSSLKGKIIKREIKKSSIIFDSIPFKRLLNTHTISKDGDSLLWVVTSKEIYKYNVKNNTDFSPKSLPIISKIIIGKDSVIFNGNNLTNENNLLKVQNKFDYSLNNIIFKFALPEYNDEKLNEFKFFLDGEAKRESNWTKETYKEFSNLYEGTYVFKLKARNVYQKETEYISFKFTILPPWYRTWWAYLLYLILLAMLIYIAIKLNSRRLEKENIRLDNIVKKRTAEIYLQKEEIQTQADNLEAINNQLKNTNEEIRLIAENLSEANKKIQDKNIQITDSINYAKKIQKAILPSSKEISKVLDDFFIIYKPKDIVGGDFYFVKKIKTHIIIATADCTGHGVPGGFLSMMGVSFLNEVIQNKNIKNPSEALNSLRNKFKYSLRQKNFFSNSIDGIDIALCDINSTNGILSYSGANSPILIIRDYNVFELEPDLQPIGIFFKEKDFSLKSFQLKLGDMIYMFSDGFQDQFGWENNKKLLYKNFKKILVRFSKLPLSEQRTQIIKSLNQWQGDTNQVDDILVFGFKITKSLISN